MRKVIDKGMPAAGAVLFVGLIKTDAPTWSLVVLTLVMYEIAQWCCRIARREAKRQRRNRYITASRTDAQRWAEQWFNPYKGVRA
jgi:hypothetical protein